jgi:uncharacterized protein YjbJ (UPF0337 family)
MTEQQPSKLKGYAQEALGAIKENVGHVLGNQQMETEGRESKLKGSAMVKGESYQSEDPRHMFPKPPFDTKTQEHPGMEFKMDPLPDYGLDTYQGSNKLAGKVAIVTGGDSGIGRAVCLAFAREGCRAVVVSYLNEHRDAEETRAAVLSNPYSTDKLPSHQLHQQMHQQQQYHHHPTVQLQPQSLSQPPQPPPLPQQQLQQQQQQQQQQLQQPMMSGGTASFFILVSPSMSSYAW